MLINYRYIMLILFFLNDLCQPKQFGSSQIDDLDTVDTIILSQSDTCSPVDDTNKIQCFRELPLAEYEVFEGEDVMMKCRVAYQKGKLQWAFKGKMLGFDREIPNNVRMRMPGNSEIGDHSLFIENVKVSDSGNYECQLSPSASQPPRRRMTKLLVLRAPTRPDIYKDGILNKHNLSVSIQKDELAFVINLTCVAHDGNPSPTFQWSVNGSRLESTSIFRFVRTQITMMNESASVLSLRSDQIVNNDVISCSVSNAATRKQSKLSERALVSEIRVFKRIRPGSLRFNEISSNINTITVQEKEQLKLTCATDDPGDPPINISWKSTQLSDYLSRNMITKEQNQFTSQSTIVIPTVDSTWHRTSLICTGSQDDLPAVKQISITVLVKHLPIKMDIAAISMTTNNTLDNPNIVYFIEGQMTKLVCSTSTFYSQSVQIVWFVKHSDQSDWRKVGRSSEKVIDMEDGRLRIIRSVLEISPSMFERNTLKKETSRLLLNVACVTKCQESNDELRRQVRIETFERPSIPIITINDEDKSPVLISKQGVKIKCTIHGGYPIPDLHLVDDNDREFKTKKYFQHGISTLEYNIEVKHKDNGRKFRCITSSKDTLDFVSLSSDLISLTVAMPPKKLSMKWPDSQFGYRADQVVSYQCFTDSSFPQAKIEWMWYHSCKIHHPKLSRMDSLSSSDLRPFCENEALEDSHDSRFEPSSQSTTSTIKIKLLPSHDMTFIECSVAPHPKWPIFTNDLSKISQLRVQYLPQLLPMPEKVYIVEEGHNMSFGIHARANPSINGYSWLMDKQPITRKSQIELKVDQFSVSNAQYDMMGNYTLLLENQLGKTALSFFLNVTFAPRLLGSAVETLNINPAKEYNHQVVITCSAQANPFRDQAKVQWTREVPLIFNHNDLVHILKGQRLFSSSPQVNCAKGNWSNGNVSVNCLSLGTMEIVSTLQVMPVDYRYIGSYKCIFSSNIKPSSAVKMTHFVFPTRPVPIRNNRRSEYAAKMGGKTEIACYFVAYPKPTVSWIRSPNFKCSENAKKYDTSISAPQVGLVKAVLAIRDTNESDIGTYICSAQNQHGKSSHSVLLAEPRRPTQPLNVTVINVTDSSITLGWIPGFNGGSKQTIELRWRPYDIGRDAEYSFMEFGENEDSDFQIYTINDLQNHKEYEVLIQSKNSFSKQSESPIQEFVKTIKYESEDEFIQSDGRKVSAKGNKGKRVQEKTDTNNILIIILLSTIGGLLIGLKIGLVTYFVRKRNLKRRKSMDKMSSPTSQRLADGFLNSADSMEMRAPSLVRSGIESNMYAQSISDHVSQNGSDNGLKLNYYKTQSDEFQTQYLSPELDLVASAMGRNNFSINGVPSNFHPAYIQLAESSSLTGYHEPYLAGYYTHKPLYHNQTPCRVINKKPNHSSIDTNALPQYPISSNYQKRVEIINYPSSAISISTASGDSNRSRSPNKKYPGYSPLIGQSGAPSTVEEYLSSANSGSDYHRFGSNCREDHVSTPMTSFHLNKNDYYCGAGQEQVSAQESILELPSHKMSFDNGMDFHYSMLDDRLRLSASSENEQLLKPPIGFSGSSNVMGPQKINETSKINYVDLISHSSPSVIRITGTMSENL